MPGIAAIVLAAGASTRMGRPKQLLPVGGVPMLVRAVGAAEAAGCRPIIVVVGRDAEACRALLAAKTDVTVVDNPDWATGLGTSLRAGASALPPDATATFLLLADQPFVTVETLRRLIDAAINAGKRVAVSAFAEQIGPPVYVSGTYVSGLCDWPHAAGAKALWQDRPGDVARVDCPEAARDVDTPADYAAARVTTMEAARCES